MRKKILIVMANYYENISKGLLISAKKILPKPINLITVPGVFEIPVTIAKNIKKFDGFVALGCVIKGETPHFDLISKAAIDGIMKLSIEHKKPILWTISSPFKDCIIIKTFKKIIKSQTTDVERKKKSDILLNVDEISEALDSFF